MSPAFSLKYDRSRTLMWTHDFGVHPRVSLTAQRIDVAVKGFQRQVLVVYDEINQLDGSTEAQIREFVKRYPQSEVTSLVLFGDPAGRNRNSTTGISDWALLTQDPRLIKYGGRVNKRASASPIVDRIDALNVKMRDANEDVGLLIHPRCERLIHDIEVTKYKMGSRDIDHGSDSKGWSMSHWSDALSYLVQQLWPVNRGARGVIGHGWSQR